MVGLLPLTASGRDIDSDALGRGTKRGTCCDGPDVLLKISNAAPTCYCWHVIIWRSSLGLVSETWKGNKNDYAGRMDYTAC
jgi:hypothetical protein